MMVAGQWLLKSWKATGVAPNETRRARILILDDDVALAEMLAEFLELSGYQTEIYSTAAAALSRLAESEFDLVISDFRMPGINGEQFFQRIRAQFPKMIRRVIFVSGDTAGTRADHFFQSNSVPCLSKPYTLAAIREVVSQCLEASRSSGENLPAQAA